MDTNRIVLITGGTSGIGLGTIAYLLKKGGYQVISLSRNEKRAQEAQEKLGDLGNDVDFYWAMSVMKGTLRAFMREWRKSMAALMGLCPVQASLNWAAWRPKPLRTGTGFLP